MLPTRRDAHRSDVPGLLAGLAMTVTLAFSLAGPALGADPWVVYEGAEGPGKGKHVVLVSGDEEYRSEEALPQLAKILAKHPAQLFVRRRNPTHSSDAEIHGLH